MPPAGHITKFTSDIQHIAGSDNVVADMLSRPPGGATAGGRLESPPRGTARANRGDKDKLNCQPHRAGSDLQWRHFRRSMPCRRPRRRPIMLPSPLIRERARSHSGQHLQHPCRWRNVWSVVWNSSAGTAGGQARHFRCFSWSSPCQHVGHQAVDRRQGHVARSQQRHGRMGKELPAV